MRRPTSSLVTIALVVALSVFLAFIASSLALARPQTGTLKASLKSALLADYSADPRGIHLAPLSEKLIEASQRDSRNLERRGGNGALELVDIFRVNGNGPPTGTPPPSPAPSVTPPESGETPPAAPTFGPAATPGPAPVPQETPASTPVVTPAATPVATPAATAP